MTTLTFTDALAAARELAARDNPKLEIVAATPQGHSTTTELLIDVHGGAREPGRVAVAIDRHASREQFQHALSEAIQGIATSE